MKDMIDRQAAIDLAKDLIIPGADYLQHNQAVNNYAAELVRLPSAQPERKTGWWLIREGISDAQCSECKMYFKDVYDIDNSDAFCRHCGVKMEGLKVVNDG